MTDIEENMPERIWAGDFNEQGFGHAVAGMQGGLYEEYVRADLAAALSGTREAVEPVASLVKMANGHLDNIEAHMCANGGNITVKANISTVRSVLSKLAAPPSDPVGQGAVMVARSDVEFLLQMAEQHPGVIAKRVAKSVRSALSPAPEAGSDEVERLVRYCHSIADSSRRADGTDIPLGEHLRACAAEITALRDQLGKMREAASAVINQLKFALFTGSLDIKDRADQSARLFLEEQAAATLAETQEAVTDAPRYIGTIGHIDRNKTALTAAVVRALSDAAEGGQ